MTRKIADCRDMPNEVGCTLSITGEEGEVVLTASQHAATVHGHTDGDELQSMVRGGLRDAPQATSPGSFVQLIEYRTQRPDDVQALLDQWLEDVGAERTAQWYILGEDRDHPQTYVEIVEFPDYESAMVNSKLPVTSRLAEKLMELVEGETVFRNLDVVRAMTP